MACFIKEILQVSKSTFMPKDEDYVRVNMVVFGPGAAMQLQRPRLHCAEHHLSSRRLAPPESSPRVASRIRRPCQD
jgi:hypothetical protein